ncbi:DUF3649 domain-containing protein [Comamonas endophytica]
MSEVAPPHKAVLPLGRYRWAIASRLLAAVAAGHALSSATAAGIGLLLARSGSTSVDAVLWASMLAFVAQALAALWAFGCVNARRAWLGICIPAALLGALAFAFRGAAV